MGLFDFVSDMGKKIFGADAEAAENIKNYIASENPGIEGLEVSYQDGVVTLGGTAASAAAMEKAVLMAGNIQGVTEVRVDNLTTPAITEKVEYYTIKSGDTLSAIAKQFYGNGSLYPRIFEANREVIKNPDLIYPGQKIRIPMD
ncbi:MAG: peptidoglycan-binding protein LysM [Desulfobaccales bacterium]